MGKRREGGEVFAPPSARCLYRLVQSVCTVLCEVFAPLGARRFHRTV
jgi:hypothetical protein